MIGLFIVVLVAIYSYLPIRASQNPILNWGNPLDWERILRHVSGKQYQVWLFSSFDSAGKQFSHFWSILPLEYFLSLLLAVVGLFISIFKARKLAWFILITFVFTVLYSINYDIHDIDSYFLLAFIIFIFRLWSIENFGDEKSSKKFCASWFGSGNSDSILFQLHKSKSKRS
jgi:hypothetical protein